MQSKIFIYLFFRLWERTETLGWGNVLAPRRYTRSSSREPEPLVFLLVAGPPSHLFWIKVEEGGGGGILQGEDSCKWKRRRYIGIWDP